MNLPENENVFGQETAIATKPGDLVDVVYYNPSLTTEGFLDDPLANLLPLDSPLFLQKVDLFRVWLGTQKKVKRPVLTSAEAARAVGRWIQEYYPNKVPEVSTAALITACDLESFKVKRIGKTRDARLGISPTTVYRLRPPGWKESDDQLHRAIRRFRR